jgi:hypothetical protein
LPFWAGKTAAKPNLNTSKAKAFGFLPLLASKVEQNHWAAFLRDWLTCQIKQCLQNSPLSSGFGSNFYLFSMMSLNKLKGFKLFI